MRSSVSAASFAALSLAGSLAAQQNDVGYGSVRGRLNLEAASAQRPAPTNYASLGFLGVGWLGGEFFCSAFAGAPSAGGTWVASGQGPHDLFVVDAAGSLVRTFAQDPVHDSSPWGMRDLATDRNGTMMGGSENGMTMFDAVTGAPTATYVAANGPQTIQSPITGPVLAAVQVIRGLAFDPAGDSGNGSFWTANYGSDLYEFDQQGNILRTVAVPPFRPWNIFGLALDPVTGNLWINAVSTGGAIAELDLATGMLTGNDIDRAGGVGSLEGGLSPVFGDDGITAWPMPNNVALVSVSQGLVDEALVHRLHALPAVAGYDEVMLETSLNGGGYSIDPTMVSGGSVLGWRLRDPTGRLTGFPGWLFANFGPVGGGATVDATTDVSAALPQLGVGILPEFVRQNSVSLPGQDPAVSIIPLTIDQPLVLTLPVNFPVGFGDLLVEQALHFDVADPGGLKATNETWRNGGQPLSGIVVRASGANSFNSDTTSGFFCVEHLGNSSYAAIANVRFDWLGSSQPSTVFDTDQGGMADRFDGGNSLAVTCRGTYRNGSAVATGLDFAVTQVSPCAPTARTGWVGSNPVPGSVGSFLTLDFPFTGGRFGPGAGRFEFDCDTDFGPTTGAGMAGMAVAITLTDGTVLSGALAANPTDPLGSWLIFP